MSLYGFISDRSMIDPNVRLRNLETEELKCGFLDRESIEHFGEPLELPDHRVARLAILYRRDIISRTRLYGLILEDILRVVVPTGFNHLTTDPLEIETEAQYPDLDDDEFSIEILPPGPVRIHNGLDFKFIFDKTKLSADELSVLAGMSSAKLDNLMNIVEYLVYGTVIEDTLPSINSYLASNPEFSGYVSSTVKLLHGNAISRVYGGVNVLRHIPKMISFSFTSGISNLDFKLWTNRADFRETYPLFTVVLVVPPFSNEYLANPSAYPDPVDAVISSRARNSQLLTPEIVANDQSGMVTFTTRFVNGNSSYRVGFDIYYRGREPDGSELRDIIIDYCQDNLWNCREIFPDIYVRDHFFLVPFYDELTEVVNTDIYRSIVNSKLMLDKFGYIVAGMRYNPDVIDIMTVAYDKLFIGVTPDTVNEIPSIITRHPTYRDFSTTDVGFNEMSMDDMEWSIAINQVLAVASGEVNNSSYEITTIGPRKFITLIRNNTAYNVMTKASYLAMMANRNLNI